MCNIFSFVKNQNVTCINPRTLPFLLPLSTRTATSGWVPFLCVNDAPLALPALMVPSKLAEHWFLSCQDPVQMVLPKRLAVGLLGPPGSAESMQTCSPCRHVARCGHTVLFLWVSLLIFDKLWASWRQDPHPAPVVPHPLTPGSVIENVLLNDSATADFSPFLKEKMLEEVTSWHTGGGDWMFSLKRQEEREGEGAGRTEKELCWQALRYKEKYNRVPAFEELIA